jgi:hypothetical protein
MDLAVKFNERDAYIVACGEAAANPWPLRKVRYLVQGASAAP